MQQFGIGAAAAGFCIAVVVAVISDLCQAQSTEFTNASSTLVTEFPEVNLTQTTTQRQQEQPSSIRNPYTQEWPLSESEAKSQKKSKDPDRKVEKSRKM